MDGITVVERLLAFIVYSILCYEIIERLMVLYLSVWYSQTENCYFHLN